MIENGRIVNVMDGAVEVETDMVSTCHGCKQQGHCPSGLLAKAKSGKVKRSVIASAECFQPGQQVQLSSSEQGVVAASAIVYLLPLLFAITAAVFGQWLMIELWLWPEWSVILLSAAAGYLGAKLAYVLGERRKHQHQYQIKITPLND